VSQPSAVVLIPCTLDCSRFQQDHSRDQLLWKTLYHGVSFRIPSSLWESFLGSEAFFILVCLGFIRGIFSARSESIVQLGQGSFLLKLLCSKFLDALFLDLGRSCIVTVLNAFCQEVQGFLDVFDIETSAHRLGHRLQPLQVVLHPLPSEVRVLP
jgi:hypothetical protein